MKSNINLVIYVAIALVVGGLVGYQVIQPEINMLKNEVEMWESITIEKNSTISLLQQSLQNAQNTLNDLQEDFIETSALYEDLEDQYQETIVNYQELLEIYNKVPLIPPEGEISIKRKPGIINGDFSDYSDGVVGWVIQGKSWHNENGVYLHQYPSSSYMTQTILVSSKEEGIVFNIKPVPVGASITLQFSVGGVILFQDTYSGNLSYDWKTIVIPFKYLLDMRELYGLSTYGQYDIRFTVVNGYDNGAHIYIDEISLIDIKYLAVGVEQPTITVPFIQNPIGIDSSSRPYTLDGWIYEYDFANKTTIPADTYTVNIWAQHDNNYLYFAVQVKDVVNYGTQFFIAFDINKDGFIEEVDDLTVLWHGDSHGGPSPGWINDAWGNPIANVLTDFHTENYNPSFMSPLYEIEIWIPMSYFPNDEHRTYFRFSPNTGINYIWGDLNVFYSDSDWQDVSTYGSMNIR